MSQTIGHGPLCGEDALLEYTGITDEEMTQPAIRLTDVACKNRGCKNYVSSDRVVTALGLTQWSARSLRRAYSGAGSAMKPAQANGTRRLIAESDISGLSSLNRPTGASG